MSWFRPTPAPSRVSILSNSLYTTRLSPAPTHTTVRSHAATQTHAERTPCTPNARAKRRAQTCTTLQMSWYKLPFVAQLQNMVSRSVSWCHGLCQTGFRVSRHRPIARKLFRKCVCVLCVVCCCVCCVLCVVVCVVGSRGFPPNANNIITRAEHPCARTSRNGTRLTCRCAPVDITATTARAHLRRHLDRPDAILRTFPPRHRRCTRS